MYFKSFSLAIAVLVCIQLISADTTGNSNELDKGFGFSEMQIIKLDQGIQNLLSSEFNNDGFKDLAVANNYKSRIEILLQKKPGQNPNRSKIFDEDINTLTENQRFEKIQIPVSVQIHNLVSGDFNSDGLYDFAYYGEPAGLYILLQKKDSSDSADIINWERPKKINVQDGLNYTNALVCTDINNDGKDDLLLAAKNGIYTITQTEAGELSKPVKYPFAEDILWVETAGLNADKNLDLIVITNQVQKNTRIRMGMGNGRFGPVRQFTIERPIAIDFVNRNNGNTKMLTIERQSGRLSCYQLTKKEKSSPEFTQILYPLPDSQQKYERDITTGDFNGDSLQDIVISFPASAEIALYQQSENGTLSDPKKFPAYSGITSIHSADIDNDSIDELIILSTSEKTVGISHFTNNRFEFPKSLNLPGEPIGIVPAELGKANTIDCFYLYRDSNDVRYMDVVYGLGTNKQKMAGLELKIDDLQSNPEGLVAADADQDGLTDLIIFVSRYTKPIFVRQTSKGKFKVIDKAGGVSALENARIEGTVLTNLDETPEKELLVAYGNFARSLVFKDQNWQVLDQYNARQTSNEIDSAITFDLDNDKKMEILLFDGTNEVVQVLKADDDKTYRFEKEFELGKWRLKKVLPYNFYGDSGLLIFDGQKFAILKTDQHSFDLDQVFSYESEIKDAKYGRMAVGNLNDNPDIETALVDYKKKYIEILSFDDSFQPSPAFRFKVFEEKSYLQQQSISTIEPREVLIDDLTADGLEDLIVIVHDRIIIYPQDNHSKPAN